MLKTREMSLPVYRRRLRWRLGITVMCVIFNLCFALISLATGWWLSSAWVAVLTVCCWINGVWGWSYALRLWKRLRFLSSD